MEQLYVRRIVEYIQSECTFDFVFVALTIPFAPNLKGTWTVSY